MTMTILPVQIRPARLADTPVLVELIEQSARGLGVRNYGVQQIESALSYAFGVDSQLIHDGTYYVAELYGTIVGCGGWSRRNSLYGGDHSKPDQADELLEPARDPAKIRAFFVHPDWARRGIARRLMRVCEAGARSARFRRMELMATLTGEPLYVRHGFQVVERMDVRLRDGTIFPVVKMEKHLLN